jgi:hypothetical protein
VILFYSDPSSTRRTIVIISTVGLTYFIPRVDDCISRFNRIVTDEAHRRGFPVFERAEIERRLMFKSHWNPKPALVNDVHLVQPGPAISSTSLLAMITCLSNSSIDASAPSVMDMDPLPS